MCDWVFRRLRDLSSRLVSQGVLNTSLPMGQQPKFWDGEEVPPVLFCGSLPGVEVSAVLWCSS